MHSSAVLRKEKHMFRETIRLGGMEIGIALRSDRFGPLLEPFRSGGTPQVCAQVSDERIASARRIYPDDSDETYLEYMELCSCISDVLIPFGRVIFHGTAFVWRKKAWIFGALSGTGKTTQYVLWKSLFGEEIQMLNGDKPLLEFRGDGIWVHPTPWRGKEHMGQMLSAPLGGVILLELRDTNRIRRVHAADCAARLFVQFQFGRNTPEQVREVCMLEERLLRGAPVWLLENRGDEASALLGYKTLAEEMSE